MSMLVSKGTFDDMTAVASVCITGSDAMNGLIDGDDVERDTERIRAKWPDVTPRDLVTLGMGVRYAYAVLTEGMDADGGVEAFADMVNALRATVEHVEDKFGIDLSGHGDNKLLRLCAGRGE